ncbi:GTPase HflX [Alienimonas chondri]|uniref:GTPase HflX n=1 Tax=Alienimonas chondri TaxID=2681879 RepID=A0ABX1VFL3_9PLAN|nr:GTPase HflX [Alienimonas chondri]NNJ26655.1 GTPase HflX [Alienimonas chondri]
MSDPKRDDLRVRARKAVLCGVYEPGDPRQGEGEARDRRLDELKGLAKTAGVKVVGELIQSRENPHPALCFGTGKAEELAQLAKSTGCDLILFDNNLSPAQGRNLEKATESVIVDRSELILDIFAGTAQTHEAKLQVELAQLLYFKPRLKRLWTHLERIEGGIGSGRGPGEKQLETDRRLVEKRISELKKKLTEIEARREREADRRTALQTTVGTVGYTNAGKSTLTRALTGADVYVADKLFATLDTRTRRWTIPDFDTVLLSDTVGFVRDLPHHLVASFRSTLEEARRADLLLHVVDASDPEAEQHIETVYEVLEEIGVPMDNMLLVLNKADAARASDRSLLDVLVHDHPDAVVVSATEGEGLLDLEEAVARKLAGGYVEAAVDTTPGNGRLLSFLQEHADVHGEDWAEAGDSVTVRCRLSRRWADKLAHDPDLLSGTSVLRLLPNGTACNALQESDAPLAAAG